MAFKKILMVVSVVALVAVPLRAARASAVVPQVMSYQAILTDDGGNLLPDGDAATYFRILDEVGTVLYEERQQVRSVAGRVSALIGNGLDAQGAPTGGVPQAVISPDGRRYLEVMVEGQPAFARMEMASVPYATFAQQALSVAVGSVDSQAIADQGIAFGDLSNDAIKGLAEALRSGSTNQVFVTEQAFAEPCAAAKVGVAPGLTHSNSSQVQGVLADLDSGLTQVEQTGQGKLDRTGGSVTGTLTMQANIELADGNTVDGVDVSLLSSQVNALDNPARLSFGRSLWGTVTFSGQSVSFAGVGATVQYISMNQCRVVFDQPMQDTTYAVTLTPMSTAQTVPGGTVSTPLVFNKTAQGFYVMTGNHFDVIVMGR